jgi:hypothetical protein
MQSLAAGLRRMDDGHRAGRVQRALHARRAEQHRTEAAVPAAADDE